MLDGVMRLFFLGTGGSWPTKRRGPMSIGLRSNTATLLLDCGEGTQRQLLSSPLSPMKIDGIFITHLHGDHFLGLPGLVQSMCLNDRKMELLIFGPEGTIDSWDHAVHMCPFTQRFPIIVKELTEGDILDIKDLKVTCVQADHSIPTLSYRFDEKERPGRFNREKAVEMGIPEGPLWGRIQRGEIIVQKKDGKEISVGPRDLLGPPRKGASIVYSGDTRASEKVVGLSSGADALIHEATFTPELQDLANEVGHSTITDAVKTARKARVKKLILVHSSPRYTRDSSFEEYRRSALELYPGVLIPEDHEELEITL